MSDQEILRLDDVLGVIRKWAEEEWIGGVITPSILADKLDDHGYSDADAVRRLRTRTMISTQWVDTEAFEQALAGVHPLLTGYDWKEAFSHATDPDPCPSDAPDLDLAGFGTADVETVIAVEAGENDGANWIVFGRLRDGRFFFLSAGCDYTGWDCQAWGSAFVGATHDDVLHHGLGDSDRKRFGLTIPL